MTTHAYSVTGMTCGHCANAATSGLTELDEVSDVSVDLVPGGTPTVTVTSDASLDEARVAAALDEAGDQSSPSSERPQPSSHQKPPHHVE